MLSTWSIMNFLNKKTVDNYWQAWGIVVKLEEALGIGVVRAMVNLLI